MLDDLNILQQYDPKGLLTRISDEYLQLSSRLSISSPDHDGREIRNIVISATGNSATAALIVKEWLASSLPVPIEVIQDQPLPAHVGFHTLFIALSFSGDTEIVTSALTDAFTRAAQTCIITSGGSLLSTATTRDIAHIKLPTKLHPHFSVIATTRALALMLAHFNFVTPDHLAEFTQLKKWLKLESDSWTNFSDLADNFAKQFAIQAHGRMNMLHSSKIFTPITRRWAINWDIAGQRTFSDYLSAANHHVAPDAATFTLIQLKSPLDSPSTSATFAAHTKTLKKLRLTPLIIDLPGDTYLAHALWSIIFGDFVTIYLAILNQNKIRF